MNTKHIDVILVQPNFSQLFQFDRFRVQTNILTMQKNSIFWCSNCLRMCLLLMCFVVYLFRLLLRS